MGSSRRPAALQLVRQRLGHARIALRLGLCNARRTLEGAKLSAAVSHNHPEGIKGAQATAAAIFLARTHQTKEEIRTYLLRTFAYDLNRSYEEVQASYSWSSSCQHSVPESLICFLESTDYEDAIRKAIALRGDADTMAAIAGSMAAAYYGEVPDDLVTFALGRLPHDFQAIIQQFDRQFVPQANVPNLA